MFADGSREPESGKSGFGMSIPQLVVCQSRRLTDGVYHKAGGTTLGLGRANCG